MDSHGTRTNSRRSLWVAFGLITGFMLVEIVIGVLANSLALLADAGHMVTDSAAIGLSLFAFNSPEYIAVRAFGEFNSGNSGHLRYTNDCPRSDRIRPGLMENLLTVFHFFIPLI